MLGSAAHPPPVVVNSRGGGGTAADAATTYLGSKETLADAIEYVDSTGNAAKRIDEITFSSKISGIDLTAVLPAITEPITIDGDGRVTIDGGGYDLGHSIFTVYAANGTTHFDGLTLTDGFDVVMSGGGAIGGGAIYATSPIAVADSTITEDQSLFGAVMGLSAVSVTDSTVSHDNGVYGSGVTVLGGYDTDPDTGAPASVTIRGTSVYDNGNSGAGHDDHGGAVLLDHTAATIADSTIADNTTSNSDYYAAVSTARTVLYLRDSTVVDNELTGGATQGAGLYLGDGSTATLQSSIVAGNGASGDPDVYADASAVTAEFSLIGDATGSGITQDTDANDILGTSTEPVAPDLSPLAKHGGPTETMMPRTGSPVIDAGDAFGLKTDQRGLPRTVDFLSVKNAKGGDGTDIGAAEHQAPLTSFRKTFGDRRVTLELPSVKTATPPGDVLPVEFSTILSKHSKAAKLTLERVQFRIDHGRAVTRTKPTDTLDLSLTNSKAGVHKLNARVTFTERVHGERRTVVDTVSGSFRVA